MIGTRASAPSRVMTGCFALLGLLAVCRPLLADVSPGGADLRRMHFDIPAQPLPSALDTLAALTGLTILVDSRIAGQTRSAAVEGTFTPSEALTRMLAGTQLAGRYASSQAVTLVARPTEGEPAAHDDDSGLMASGVDYSAPAGRIQAALTRTLCSAEVTRPGRYRLAMQVWVDGAGHVGSARLLSSTGVPARDDAVLDGIRGTVVEPPPSSMPQPITLLIEAGNKNSAAECRRLLAQRH